MVIITHDGTELNYTPQVGDWVTWEKPDGSYDSGRVHQHWTMDSSKVWVKFTTYGPFVVASVIRAISVAELLCFETTNPGIVQRSTVDQVVAA